MRQLERVMRFAITRAARVPDLQRPAFAAFARLFPDQPWSATHRSTARWTPTPAASCRNGCCSRTSRRPSAAAPYAGCQPACVRAALDRLPDPAASAFSTSAAAKAGR
nr:hypothetical protein [uncultured Lichenicoccus sp.]